MEGIDTLRSYEAIYDHGKMQWLGDQPVDVEARVIVTIFPNKTASSASGMKHQPSHWIAGKGKVRVTAFHQQPRNQIGTA